jgi:hypothetical protein
MRLLTPTNGRRTPTEKLTLQNGVPVTIALQYSTGKQVPSLIPGAADQMFYTLTDGRHAYFPLEVAGLIDDLQLQSREPFTICKYGPREWQVERENPYAGQAAASPPPASIPNKTAAGAPAPAAAPQPAAVPQAAVNGAGHTAADLYIECFRDATAIALAAVDIAKAKGLMISPTFEDLRCIATTLRISSERRL